MDVNVAEPGKPNLGGWLPPISFTEEQAAILNAAADELIPGGDGFPAPSEVDVIAFIARYIAPSGEEPRWFPFLGEEEFKYRIDALGGEFTRASRADKISVLKGLEQKESEFFGRLRDLVYYAYYSRPEVIKAINRKLPAGRDYRNSPQPYGYLDVIADWDEELLDRVRGTYKRTEDVKRLSPSMVAEPVPAGAAPAAAAGQHSEGSGERKPR
jgi:Gluconate 2-dehydrogenase subunit 3